MKLGPGLSFSWKRALGVTKAKRQVCHEIMRIYTHLVK
jgi:hypothetical protein